jgi:hypothetical protein
MQDNEVLKARNVLAGVADCRIRTFFKIRNYSVIFIKMQKKEKKHSKKIVSPQRQAGSSRQPWSTYKNLKITPRFGFGFHLGL